MKVVFRYRVCFKVHDNLLNTNQNTYTWWQNYVFHRRASLAFTSRHYRLQQLQSQLASFISSSESFSSSPESSRPSSELSSLSWGFCPVPIARLLADEAMLLHYSTQETDTSSRRATFCVIHVVGNRSVA